MNRTRRICLVSLTVCLLVSGCATEKMPGREPQPPESALAAAADGVFFDVETALHQQHGENSSGFMLLDRSEAGLRWRLALIDSAQVSIDAQYYLWYGDAVGRLLIQHILDAADRGVRVRLLVDDLNTLIRTATKVELRDSVAALIDAHPNIELRLFNPWSRRDLAGRLGETLGDLKRINQRMHNKALIVDNRAAIVGGRNIGDEYMGLSPTFNFHDLDVLGIGPVARQTSSVFDLYWNSRWVLPVAALDIPVTPEAQAAGRTRLSNLLDAESSLAGLPRRAVSWETELRELPRALAPGTSVVYADLPSDTGFDQLMLEHIRSMLETPSTELMIVNAYIIPIERSITTLRTLTDRGVRIRILTNSLASQDVPAVNSHYRPWRKPILEAGASLYEIRHDAAIGHTVVDTPPVSGRFMGLHSKAMVVDRRHVYIGSMNFDPRSAAINTEMGAFIDSPELAEALASLIERDLEPGNSWQVELNDDGHLRWVCDTGTVTRQPARNFWQRVEDVFFGIFPKEYY